MRKIIYIILFLLTISLTSCEGSFEPLDKIHDYRITITPNDDGTLNMQYYLKWEVLDDGDEGLSWIVVGVANRYVSNIKALTNNISDIYYTSDDGAQIRLDLDKTYYKGAVLELKFSFIQSRIFSLSNDEVEYAFIPGWFEEIQVDKLQVKWKVDNTIYANTSAKDGWLVWETALDYGESTECQVKYQRNNFPNLNPDEDYSDQTLSDFEIYLIIGVVFALVIAIIVFAIINHDPYSECRGFSGRIHWYHYRFGRYRGYRRSGKRILPPNMTSSGSGSHGGSCACACACACAGGGRAGCSRKEFTKALKI